MFSYLPLLSGNLYIFFGRHKGIYKVYFLIRARPSPPPLIRAMPERKHFFSREGFPYWRLQPATKPTSCLLVSSTICNVQCTTTLMYSVHCTYTLSLYQHRDPLVDCSQPGCTLCNWQLCQMLFSAEHKSLCTFAKGFFAKYIFTFSVEKKRERKWTPGDVG